MTDTVPATAGIAASVGCTSSRARVDRDEVFLEYTKSVCPVCRVVVDAQVNIRLGKVYLRKRCRDHGEFEALIYGDAQRYLDSARFNKPGTIPLQFQTEVRDGCPADCGLCPEHKQHVCLGIIEVNTNCNLDCPVCFADSGHQPHGYSINLEQCERMLDVYVAAEGEPEVIMFSGGEPTIHPRILDFIDAARARPIRTVVLNTNGIRLASDGSFAAALAERQVTVYLQCDGFSERAHREIRGRDLRERKQRALDNCAEAGVTVMLAVTVERGLNDSELGEIVRFAVVHPAVHGVVFQPVMHAGRHIEFDPLTRLTNSDVIDALCAQAPQWLRPSDFFPVPCCFPDLPLGHLPAHRRRQRRADPAAGAAGGLPGLSHQPSAARRRRARRAGKAVVGLSLPGLASDGAARSRTLWPPESGPPSSGPSASCVAGSRGRGTGPIRSWASSSVTVGCGGSTVT